jgi:hypothetical protein
MPMHVKHPEEIVSKRSGFGLFKGFVLPFIYKGESTGFEFVPG